MEEEDESVNESVNHEGVCRTAPASPGLLKIYFVNLQLTHCNLLLLQLRGNLLTPISVSNIIFKLSYFTFKGHKSLVYFVGLLNINVCGENKECKSTYRLLDTLTQPSNLKQAVLRLIKKL